MKPFLFLMVLFGSTALAQEPITIPFHATQNLHRTAQGQLALQRYHVAKQAGLLPIPKTLHPPEIGDTLTFNVAGFLLSGWQPRPFVLKAKGTRFLLWVSVPELENGNVSDTDVATLAEALSQATPALSINPNAGILENAERIFGSPPDYDQNGAVHILWYDISDDFGILPDGGLVGQHIAGYVTPVDLDPNAPANEGNQADVVYVDTNPLLTNTDFFGMEDVQTTIAHEFQHLIHFQYDVAEIPFVNEGLSEWAELLNGYEGRPIFYLNPSRFSPPTQNTPLLEWNGLDTDFQRAGLFTTYLADQFGLEAMGKLAQIPLSGVAGYEAWLDSLSSDRSLADLVLDFHTANYLNDTTLDLHFGYQTAQREALKAAPTETIEGSRSLQLPAQDIPFRSGGVFYTLWENVRDFRFQFDRNVDAVGTNLRERIRTRAILETLDGTTSWVDLEAGDVEHELHGDFERITFVTAHIQPDEADVDGFIAATWAGTAFPVENVQYDDGQIIQNAFFALAAGADGRVATRFIVPEGATLARVYLANYYFNQFFQNGSPIGSTLDPRDFTLRLWAGDGNGRPGEEIFSLDVQDPRPHTFAVFDFNLYPIDLSTFAGQLSVLPDTIFVGFTEAGDDQNFMVIGSTQYAIENTSFIWDGVQWARLWDQTISTGVTLENTTLPIRVKFRFSEDPVDVEAEGNVPASIVLEPNFPNPFAGTTNIRYRIEQVGPVRLTIYDVLGRSIATPVDAPQPAGTYTVTLETANWPAGLYVYELEAGGDHRTQTMLLVR